MSSNSDPNIPNVATATPVKKKSGTGSKIFSIIIILAALAFGGYYLATNYLFAAKHSITIEGNKITTGTTGQDILDMGFVLCDVTGNVKDVMGTTIKQKAIYGSSYYIGVPDSTGKHAKCSGVAVVFGNFRSANYSFAKCELYSIEYSPKFHDDGVKVLVDDVDMKDADLAKWTDFLKEKGYKYSQQELDDLKSGKSTYELFTQAKLNYSVSTDKTDGKTSFGSLKIQRDVKVNYNSNK